MNLCMMADRVEQYYISVPTDTNDYKGVGPFMWASYEYEIL